MLIYANCWKISASPSHEPHRTSLNTTGHLTDSSPAFLLLQKYSIIINSLHIFKAITWGRSSMTLRHQSAGSLRRFIAQNPFFICLIWSSSRGLFWTVVCLMVFRNTNIHKKVLLVKECCCKLKSFGSRKSAQFMNKWSILSRLLLLLLVLLLSHWVSETK